ncbi:putative molybdopterin cofactor sulfurase [Hibiscus syriacus]|uniref:Molybdopterin cofactor sulfurase n=1 Tax=Hibiscus syriacus TaxID=106335 RepID=A0A6A2YWA8_HIBSY|nr:scopoletin 8-hydroxylase-like [Hibiscus syriacus]KAE8683718.1 putative molybdopterin cofactor sulfurase [Hibiscus syriacus]
MAPCFDNQSSLFNFVVRDGNGVKGTVDSSISKVPWAYIQPPAEQINKNNATKCEILPIDLLSLDGPDHDEVVNQIVRAAETLGFFQVINRGVPEDVDMEKKGEWVEIPPVPGALVINVGDMLQIWSNGRYKSAEYRVRTTSTKSRVSIPIFVSPQGTQKIAPLPQVVEKDGVARYRELVFSDYMNCFFGNAHDGKKSLGFAKTN